VQASVWSVAMSLTMATLHPQHKWLHLILEETVFHHLHMIAAMLRRTLHQALQQRSHLLTRLEIPRAIVPYCFPRSQEVRLASLPQMQSTYPLDAAQFAWSISLRPRYIQTKSVD
jgi:hypothetical protein